MPAQRARWGGGLGAPSAPTLVAPDSQSRTVLRSTDHGASWSSVANALPVGSFGGILAYSAPRGRLLMTASAGATYVATSDDKGLTWTQRVNNIGATYGDPVYSTALDLFVANRSDGYAWSGDGGVTWNVATVPVGLDVFDQPGWSQALGIFVATAYSSGADTCYLLVSIDGKNWTATALATRAAMVSWAAGAGVLCGVGFTRDDAAHGAAKIAPKLSLTTANGIASTITNIEAKSDASFGAVCRSERLGIFVAGLTNKVALSTQNIITSPDGNAWTTRVLQGLDTPFNKAVHAIVDDGTNLVTLGADPAAHNAGNISSDAVTWARVATPAGVTCRSIASIP